MITFVQKQYKNNAWAILYTDEKGYEKEALQNRFKELYYLEFDLDNEIITLRAEERASKLKRIREELRLLKGEPLVA
jgi:hypothetical protein